jgi:hypothetical protein
MMISGPDGHKGDTLRTAAGGRRTEAPEYGPRTGRGQIRTTRCPVLQEEANRDCEGGGCRSIQVLPVATGRYGFRMPRNENGKIDRTAVAAWLDADKLARRWARGCSTTSPAARVHRCAAASSRSQPRHGFRAPRSLVRNIFTGAGIGLCGIINALSQPIPESAPSEFNGLGIFTATFKARAAR